MPGLNEIKSWLSQNSASPLKGLSQNFLIDNAWIGKITKAAIDDLESEQIWEVGPGLGALTEILAKQEKPLVLFELDRKYAEHLRDTFPNATLIEGDFLKNNLGDYLGNKQITLISNLPYHLSSEILFRVLDLREHFSRLVLMFQYEFAERLKARPKTKEYGILSVLFQSFYQMESLGKVPKTCFYPSPKVHSQVLVFKPLAYSGPDISMLKTVVQVAFSHRRKKLISNIKGQFPESDIADIWKTLGLSENARAEELEVKQFWSLAQLL